MGLSRAWPGLAWGVRGSTWNIAVPTPGPSARHRAMARGWAGGTGASPPGAQPAPVPLTLGYPLDNRSVRAQRLDSQTRWSPGNRGRSSRPRGAPARPLARRSARRSVEPGRRHLHPDQWSVPRRSRCSTWNTHCFPHETRTPERGVPRGTLTGLASHQMLRTKPLRSLDVPRCFALPPLVHRRAGQGCSPWNIEGTSTPA